MKTTDGPRIINKSYDQKPRTASVQRRGKNIYLSVDLDFWCHGRVDLGFLQRVIASVGPANVAAAIEHDSILPHLRRFGEDCTKLVNLDWHSDLGGVMNVMFEDGDVANRGVELHSGSWVGYVPWPTKREYEWAYPDLGSRQEGRCDRFSSHKPFGHIDQREWISETDKGWDSKWGTLHRTLTGPPDYKIALDQVRAASITLSPDCCGADAVDAFRKLVADFKLELLDVLPSTLATIRQSETRITTPTPDISSCRTILEKPHEITDVDWVEAPESGVMTLDGHWSYYMVAGPARESIRSAECWVDKRLIPGDVIRQTGAWYDLDSDMPEDGLQDRALCPSKLWEVVEVEAGIHPCSEDPPGRGRSCYRVDAVGQVVELHVINNRPDSTAVVRRALA